LVLDFARSFQAQPLFNDLFPFGVLCSTRMQKRIQETFSQLKNTYMSKQYGRFQQDWRSISASFLFLNNGMHFIDSVTVDNTKLVLAIQLAI
jgi:hypothetical protein